MERAIAAYEKFANVEIIVYTDLPGCGPAWARGADAAQGDYIHFGADDVEMHGGWAEAAIETVDRGYIPAPRVLNTDGSLQSCGGSDGWETEHETGEWADFSRGPVISRDWWQTIRALAAPFLEQTHYFTDNCISFTARLYGIETGVHRGYEYTHHLAQQSRGAGMSWNDRMHHDRDIFELYASYADALTGRETITWQRA